jgi:hypothetical protein
MSDSFLARLSARLANAFGHFQFQRPAERKPLKGFRLARSGKHRGTMLTKDEQVRNPAGSKLWSKCPEKNPEWL